jgi:4'-phosphopantetheinyl transferase
MAPQPGISPDATLTAPELVTGDVHVWTIRLDADRAPDASALDACERERAAAFVFERDRVAFVRRRAALRRILGAYLGVPAADVPIRAGDHGKPELGPPFDRAGLQFNVSNSGDLALCAVTLAGPVGIDVEQVRPMADLDGVAELVLSRNERAAFAKADEPDRLTLFHAAWTRKEAYLKARGEGLLRSPTLIEFGALLGEAGEPIRDSDDAGAAIGWQVTAWQPAPGFGAALVIKNPCGRIGHFAISA